MSQQYQIIKDVMGAINEAFAPVMTVRNESGDLYYEINGEEYCLQYGGGEYFWDNITNNSTDNEVYYSATEALQAMLDFAQSEIYRKRQEVEDAEDDRLYGTYEQQRAKEYHRQTGGWL